LHLVDITEKGVTFQSLVDGKPMLLTHEESIEIQNWSRYRLGGSIMKVSGDVGETSVMACNSFLCCII